MALLEGRPAATLKDSFAALELEREGFQVLFEARWLWHASAASGAPAREDALTVLDTQEQLSEWAAAAGLSDVLGPRVLSAPVVRVLAARGPAGRVGAGAILTRSGDLVGVSNAFATDLALERLWSAIRARRRGSSRVARSSATSAASISRPRCGPASRRSGRCGSGAHRADLGSRAAGVSTAAWRAKGGSGRRASCSLVGENTVGCATACAG